MRQVLHLQRAYLKYCAELNDLDMKSEIINSYISKNYGVVNEQMARQLTEVNRRQIVNIIKYLPYFIVLRGLSETPQVFASHIKAATTYYYRAEARRVSEFPVTYKYTAFDHTELLITTILALPFEFQMEVALRIAYPQPYKYAEEKKNLSKFEDIAHNINTLYTLKPLHFQIEVDELTFQFFRANNDLFNLYRYAQHNKISHTQIPTFLPRRPIRSLL